MATPHLPPGAAEDAIRDTAHHWVVRQDRGLTSEESMRLASWLATDPRHAEALARSQAAWDKFRELGQTVQRGSFREEVRTIRWPWLVGGAMAAAAVVVLGLTLRERLQSPLERVAVVALVPESQIRKLSDGSVATLKPGAEITTDFSATERRVRLLRGEAFFSVSKDAARPFFVEAGSVTVRAVGTAFAVREAWPAVDVLVTEGVVQVSEARASRDRTAKTAAALNPEPPMLVGAGHRAVVTRTPESATGLGIVVSAVSSEEINHALAWHETMLDLTSAPLGELVRIYVARSGLRMELGDSALESLQVGGRLPMSDAEGFIRALEQIADVKAERRADGVLVLSKRK